MIAVRRAEDRLESRHPLRVIWSSFAPNETESGFGLLLQLDEVQLSPRGRYRLETKHSTELFSYVVTGAVAHVDAAGEATVLQAGQFQRATLIQGSLPRQVNALPRETSRVFDASLRCAATIEETPRMQRRFSTAQRRGCFCVVAAAAEGGNWLRLQADVLVCSALLEPGRHLTRALAPGRCAWLHVVTGSVRLGTIILTAGDAVSLVRERAISATALVDAEILLFDLPQLSAARAVQ